MVKKSRTKGGKDILKDSHIDIGMSKPTLSSVQTISAQENPPKRAHSESTADRPDGLPPVKDIIDGASIALFKNAGASATNLILHSIFCQVYRNQMWRQALNQKFQDIEHCEKTLAEEPSLSILVNECVKSSDYRRLFDSDFLRLTQRKKRKSQDYSLKLEDFKNAFEHEYTAPSPDILLKTMDLYIPTTGVYYYNRSFPIVQSSGMGKSRLVDHSAKLRFTLPINLEKIIHRNVKTYPPADENVRDHLTAPTSSEDEALIRHLSFLEALFVETVTEIKSYPKGSVEAIALKWYEWMKEGSTSESVGINRSNFYDRVIGNAQKFEERKDFMLLKRGQKMVDAAKAFCSRLTELHGSIGNRFLAIVYFDEAHTLHSEGDSSSYFALMRALNDIVDLPIFFVFLSTNTSLQSFSPTRAMYPSARVKTSHDLIPPFFELPFDSFCQDFTTRAKEAGKMTLNGVCELKQMSKFGRPMWYSHYMSTSDDPNSKKNSELTHPTIELAFLKLGYGLPIEDNISARLAALDSRILLQFDPYSSRQKQAEMVRSHMRCVFVIPKNREYMWSGYPSEPMISEAAARLLNGEDLGKCAIAYVAPKILVEAINTGLIARGERGETVARLLLTIAHDLAVIRKHPQLEYGPHFHRPIPLLHLLQELFSVEVWKNVCQAKPVHAYPDSELLGSAFSKCWVNYSHFARLGDHASFEVGFASELLKRGTAMQAYDNQRNQDIGIPVHFGGADTEICKENTTIVQLQIKNTKDPAKVFPDPKLVGPIAEHLPILSIVMQLGATKHAEKETVVVNSVERKAGHLRGSKSDIHGRHYEIIVYGCTSATYQCIPKTESATYASLLMSRDPFADAPRNQYPDNQNAYYALKPMLHKSISSSSCWNK